MMVWSVCLLAAALANTAHARLAGANLRPQDNEVRTTHSLDGLWKFKADYQNVGFNHGSEWYQAPFAVDDSDVLEMPVPASFNDITQDWRLREYVGVVWYQTQAAVPFIWSKLGSDRVYLRFESAHYFSWVWVNGQLVVEHDGGHLPFEADITELLSFTAPLLITVAVNNTLDINTIPPGGIVEYPDGPALSYQMDFFNYAGIHRTVKLYTVPETFISDVVITTNSSDEQSPASVSFQLEVQGPNPSSSYLVAVAIIDADGDEVASLNTAEMSGSLQVPNPKLWWPVGMSDNVGQLYTLRVTLIDSQSTKPIDTYRQSFGIRSVQVTSTQFLINGRPFYFHGAAKHEDWIVRGKGFDWPSVIKDFNLINWLGMNSFRTSHYPYASEILDECDKRGIVVIDECPGVGILHFNMRNDTLAHHKIVMEEIVRRDKNHPAVVMYSVANEPDSNADIASWYFSEVISHTKSLDTTRPVTFVSDKDYNNDVAVQYADVICINRYYGWYTKMGRLTSIAPDLRYNFQQWLKLYSKPIIVTEYGADTVPGEHSDPPLMFSEEYQVSFFQQYFSVFDEFRGNGLIGEHIWNFADFMTTSGGNRVLGNRKGIFTRDRQPKSGAFVVKQRYTSLIEAGYE